MELEPGETCLQTGLMGQRKPRTVKERLCQVLAAGRFLQSRLEAMAIEDVFDEGKIINSKLMTERRSYFFQGWGGSTAPQDDGSSRR